MKKKIRNGGRVLGGRKFARIEALEGRRMLAATPPPVLGEDHVLRITGTAEADRITLCRILVNDKDEIKVVFNKRRSYFSTSEIEHIEIMAGAGDDRVGVDAASEAFRVGVWADGGEGDDTLLTASGNDTLIGQEGDDLIGGGGGNDDLAGEVGNDTITGGKGDDGLYGGAGNDLLADDRGDNVFRGGAGRDDIRRGVVAPDEFVIGVWGQPSNYAWRWKERGVNTMVAAELMGGRVPMSKWDDEVAQNGMYMIRQPSDHPEEDSKYGNLIAWLAPDEPDVHHTDPAVVQATYSRLKKINPDLPVFLNFSGGHVVGYQESNQPHPYAEWLKGTDWASNDIYPVAGWNLPDRLWLVGQAIDKLRALAPDKPQFAFIETSDQGLSWNMGAPGPNPDQFRAEIWNAVIHGARGIIYFADQFKPSFSYNATPPEVEAEMRVQNAKLKDLGGVLLSKIDPKGYGVEVPAGMEATVRTYKGKTYLIVLNIDGKAVNGAKIKVTGVADGTAEVHGENRTVQIQGGEIVDDFAGYTPRVYVVG